jgi:acetyl-CoA C-acetyltransferase
VLRRSYHERKRAKERTETFGQNYFHGRHSHHPKIDCNHSGFDYSSSLEKAEMTLRQIDLIEINEAFAAMPLVSDKILADGNPRK